MDAARAIQVIETTLTRRGEGKTEADPLRVITQYWSLDGEMLAEVDPFRGPTLSEQVEAVAREIFNAMPFDGQGEKPSWVPGGNAIKQDECRRRARAALNLTN